MRAETGSMQFGNDWRGVFIRGDYACYYATTIKIMLDFLEKNPPGSTDFWILRQELVELKCTLEQAHAQTDPNETIQQMKPFEECVREEGK